MSELLCKTDFHIHTTFSDGTSELHDYVKIADFYKFKTIAFTDHIWSNSKWFPEYVKMIEDYQCGIKTELLVGFEAKALSPEGELDVSEEATKLAKVRLGAIHRIPVGYNKFLTREEVMLKPMEAYLLWLKTTKNMITHTLATTIAHPCFVLTKYDIIPNWQDIYALFELAYSNNVFLELSGKHKLSNKYLLDITAMNPKFQKCLSYGSDSHCIDDFIKYNLDV